MTYQIIDPQGKVDSFPAFWNPAQPFLLDSFTVGKSMAPGPRTMHMEKRLNFLTIYTLISTVVFAFIILTSFNESKKNATFDEITVKRINLIEEEGDIRMVLSNATRQRSGRMNGQDMEQRVRPPGILFFNKQGALSIPTGDSDRNDRTKDVPA